MSAARMANWDEEAEVIARVREFEPVIVVPEGFVLTDPPEPNRTNVVDMTDRRKS